ncbi:MAG: hypothetical protein ABIM89_17950 [Mycobacteriales bacterium]
MDERVASLAELTDEIEDRSRSLVETTRRYSTGQWRRSTGVASVAESVQALVTRLAELEHAVEVAAGERPAAWRSPSPAPYPGALPDRLAVVSNDLVAVLRAAPGDLQVWYADELVAVVEIAKVAAAAVRRIPV